MKPAVNTYTHSHLYELQMHARSQAQSLRDAVRVARDRHGGYGVFAVKDLPANTLRLPYIGEHLTHTAHESRYTDCDPGYTLEVGEVFIDAVHMPRVACAHMVNHSDRPNCTFEEDSAVNDVDIRTGDELTVNYGRAYFQSCQRSFPYNTSE